MLTGLAVAFAVGILVFSMALQQGSYVDMIYNTVHAHTGHLQIQRTGYHEDHDLSKGLHDAQDILAFVEHRSMS
ncbi:MAG: hypothetical protein GKR87_10925 [Kiritimatiellae bacterium]|nr:hypothetical protein [Kiritimatiellia bacterium]